MTMTTAEWRWADVATGALGISEFAGLNPLRWSGGASIEATIQDLKGQDQGRPIILKVPPGVLSAEKKFPNVPIAIDWLKKRAGVGVEWMWGDAPRMQWLPMKWSATKGIEKTMADLREKERAEPNRPVLLKIPAGVLTPAKKHENISAAIDHLDRALRHFSKWSVDQTFFLSDEIREPENFLRLRDVPLLDKATYTGVLFAVDKLNVCEGLCTDGICAVYSSRRAFTEIQERSLRETKKKSGKGTKKKVYEAVDSPEPAVARKLALYLHYLFAVLASVGCAIRIVLYCTDSTVDPNK